VFVTDRSAQRKAAPSSATSSSMAYASFPKRPERSRSSRLSCPVQWVSSCRSVA
jgi:hypothetical protein